MGQNGRGSPSPGTPSWLDLAGLGRTPDVPNSRPHSAEGSLGPFGAESQGRVQKDLLQPRHELCGALPCHTPLASGGADSLEPRDPQGPLANPVCAEEAMAAMWEWPWALEKSSLKTCREAAYSFQEVIEPAMVAVDRQAIFPDTWSLMEEYDQQKDGARTQPRKLGSSCPAAVDKEQLGGEVPELAPAPEALRGPEGIAGAASEARKEQPEHPRAMVMDTPNAMERISTSSQAGTSSHSC